MRNALLFFFVLLPQLLVPTSMAPKSSVSELHGPRASFTVFTNPYGLPTSPQPIFVRLQALQEGSVIFSESIPQSLQDHVATIDVSVLAVLVSSNARSIDLYNDDIGNLWLAVNYTINEGDFISTLAWVSSETVSENLTLPESISFPESYPDDIQPFLNPGRKLPVNNPTIGEIAETYTTQDMIETVENIVNFVNKTQRYDREKIKLLMTGRLNTTDILDFLNDPLESLETGNSFCFERALLATTILRAAKVPARTFTNIDLKTWIQVWLPKIGWVDAEVLSFQPRRLFPRPLSFTVPRMIENSSNAMFPFTWLPRTLMRIVNLTFGTFETFDINDYGTVLSQPIDEQVYNTSPDKYVFPIVFEPEMVQVAFTRNSSDITLHLSNGEKKASETLILEEANRIEFEGLVISFEPFHQGDMVILHNFSVQGLVIFDIRILILVGVVPVILIFWFFWKRKRVMS